MAALSRVELVDHTHSGELPHMVTEHVVTQGHMGNDSPDSQCHLFQCVPQSVLTMLVPFTVAELSFHSNSSGCYSEVMSHAVY